MRFSDERVLKHELSLFLDMLPNDIARDALINKVRWIANQSFAGGMISMAADMAEEARNSHD